MKVAFAYFDTDFHHTGMGEMSLFVRGTTDLPLGLGCLRSFAASDPEIGPRLEMSNHVFPHDRPAVEAAGELLSVGPDVVAFGCYVWNLDRTMETARCLKEAAPRLKVVVGGPEVPRDPALLAEFASEHDQLDAVVCGEGEATFLELLKSYRGRGGGPEDVPGLACRDAGRVVVTPARPLIEDLGRIPSPYVTGAVRLRRGATGFLGLETSRGCPFRCRFCDYHTGMHGVRFFPLERFSRELRLLDGREFRGYVQLVDPAVNYKRRWVAGVLDALRDFKGNTALDLGPSLVDGGLVRKVGALAHPIVFLGIQSTNPAANRDAGRPLAIRKAAEVVGSLVAYPHARVLLELILGLPGDDYESFKRTVDWAMGFRPLPTLYFFDLEVHPNSAFHGMLGRFRMRTDRERIVSENYSFAARDIVKASRLVAAYNSIAKKSGVDPRAFEAAFGRRAARPSDFLEALGAAMVREGRLPRRRLRIHKLDSFVDLPDALVRRAMASCARRRR